MPNSAEELLIPDSGKTLYYVQAGFPCCSFAHDTEESPVNGADTPAFHSRR